MSEELPKGWVKIALAEACVRVATIRPEDWPTVEFTYFDIGGVDNKTNTIAETKTFLGSEAPSRARQSIRKEDILFATVRTQLKNIARVELDYSNPVASTGFVVIRAQDAILPKFLFWQVLSDDFLQPLHKLQSGSSYPAVRAKDVFAQPIRLAPAREQERIIAKLDVVFPQVAAAEAATRRALDRLQRYRAAVLSAAVTGELTNDWRKAHPAEETGRQLLERLLAERRLRWEQAELDLSHGEGTPTKSGKWKRSTYPEPAPANVDGLPQLPSTWQWSTLETIAEIGSGMSVSQTRVVKNAASVPYLRVANVLRGRLDLSEIKFIEVDADQVQSLRLRHGDILFTEGGDRDKLGRGWIWEEQIPGCIHQNHVFRARLIDHAAFDPRLISHWGNTFGQQFFMRHGTQSTNLASINQKVLARLPIPIIPVAEQAVIIRELDNRLAAAQRLEDTLNRQLDRAQATRRALLRDAFTGKLVPQDSEDEPASVLLGRIRAAIDADVTRPKAKRMPKSKQTKVDTLRDLEELIDHLGGSAAPEHILHAAGLGDDVERFFDLLRAGRKAGTLRVSTGTAEAISRIKHAN